MNLNDYIEYSGGRAGLHEFGWVQAGYDLDEVESIMLTQEGVGLKALSKICALRAICQ